MKKSYFISLQKKYLFVSLCLLLGIFCSEGAFAQEDEEGGNRFLKYGAKIGGTISSFTNQQPHNNLIHGVTAGVFINHSFSEKIGVQTEILYAQEGGRLLSLDIPYLLNQENWYIIDIENQKLVLHNLNLPILFKYNMLFDNLTLSAVIGPDLGYTIGAITYKEGTVITESGAFHTYTGNENVTSNMERYNIAATAGMGIEIPAGKHNLLFDVRYRYGITASYKSYSYVGIPQVSGDLSSHSVSITIGVGF